MKHNSVMIKPASGLCNMRCTYCFYADVAEHRTQKDYGMMPQETARAIVRNMLAELAPGDRATLAFQGGEPTLAGLVFFEELLSFSSEAAQAREVGIEYALQTNGMTMDEGWLPLLKAHPILVGLSIDGDKQLHDWTRKDSNGEGTYKRVVTTKRLLDENQIPYNVLVTLTRQGARHPQKLWNFLVKEGIDYVQFTPCLDAMDAQERSPFALTPEGFYQFYATLFPLWAAKLREGKYISVKFFDDLVNYFGRGMPTACGISGRCGVQFVCEGDGTAFPCDFYMLDEYAMGSLAEHTPEELRERAEPFSANGRDYFGAEPCQSCKYRTSCAGGCKRMVDTMYLSKGVCWYARLLDEILPPLLEIGRRMQQG